MATLLLIIVYLAFISLGLPDSLLGSAWPVIHTDFSVPVSYAGAVSMIISGGTIISSFFSSRFIRAFGTGLVTFVSVLLTAGALLGFAFSGAFYWLCVFAIPLGLGAGAVDSALNNYIAVHYHAMHMNWLHCFWGLGASIGPYILSSQIDSDGGWRQGYLIIALIQFSLVVILLFSLPLWNRKNSASQESSDTSPKMPPVKLSALLRMPGAKASLFSFFCYCSLEGTVMAWGSTFLVQAKGIAVDTAAQWISMFFLGITLGRGLSGFLSIKAGSRTMIRAGLILIVLGILLFLLPFGGYALFWGLFVVGLGCAPIYPAMLHLTPENFGKEISLSIMGIQMASAYTGSTFIPPIFGMIVQYISPAVFPFFLLGFLILMTVSIMMLNRSVSSKPADLT